MIIVIIVTGPHLPPKDTAFEFMSPEEERRKDRVRLLQQKETLNSDVNGNDNVIYSASCNLANSSSCEARFSLFLRFIYCLVMQLLY